MFGKHQQDELLREVTALRQRVAELEAERVRGLRLDSVTGLLSAQGSGGGRAVLAASAGEVLAEPEAPQQDAIEALALALLERDRYTGEHSEAVIEMSAAVARNLGCSAQEVERIKSAALLHDIG